MTVTLILPNEEEIKKSNSLFKTSELITNLLIDTGEEDVRITISSIYASVIDIYLEFLNKISFNNRGEVIYPDDLPIINDTKTLFLCFLLESFFADNAFFQYLMKESYRRWNEFLPDVHLLPDERLFYLYTPYEFVSDKYLNSQTFFNEWLKINENKEIVLNGSGIYYTKVEYYPNREIKLLQAYHTINNKETGYKFVIAWYGNGQFKYKDKYKDGKRYGLHKGWHEDGQLQYEENYEDGKLDGLQEAWYENGQAYYKYKYKHGNRDGLSEEWYKNGKLRYKRNYKDDELDGLQEAWYEDGRLNHRYLYDMGRLFNILQL